MSSAAIHWSTSSSCFLRGIGRVQPRAACSARMMFSRTVSSSTSPSVRRFSGQNATPCAVAARGLRIETGLPSIVISPASARSAPNSRRASSVRPEPSRPASPTTSPRCSARSNGAIAPLRPTALASSTGVVASSESSAVRGFFSSASSVLSSRPSILETSSTRLSSVVVHSPTSRPLRRTVIRSEIS